MSRTALLLARFPRIDRITHRFRWSLCTLALIGCDRETVVDFFPLAVSTGPAPPTFDAATPAPTQVKPTDAGPPAPTTPPPPIPDAAAPPETGTPQPDPLDAGNEPSEPVVPDFTAVQPTRLDALSTNASEDDPTLSASGLEIFFNSVRPAGKGKGDIWRSTRDSLGAAWSQPTPVETINTTADETTPSLSIDGITLFFATDQDSAGKLDIWSVERLSDGVSFTQPKPVEVINSAASEYAPFMSASGKVLVFNREKKIMIAERADQADNWSQPKELEFTGPPGELTDARYLDEGRLLLVSQKVQNRGLELAWAIRADINAPFPVPQPFEGELNSPQNDHDLWFSPNLGYVVFTSKRNGKNDDLFEAKLSP